MVDGTRTSPFILASESPRRRDLLGRLGFDFEMRRSGVDEDLIIGVSGSQTAELRASAKAHKAVARVDSGLILSADTVIELDGADLGKTESAEVARKILRSIAGRPCNAITAVTLLEVHESGSVIEHNSTVLSKIWMKPYDLKTIDWYVSTGEFRGRAGAFAIQGLGCELVERWEGCFLNIVGLPLCEVVTLMSAVGLPGTLFSPSDCCHR